MSLEIWIAFTLASAALLAIPGPTVMLVVSYALGRGRATGWATVPGVTLGDFTAMTLSLLGAGAVLAASASLFTALKLLGAAYLVWLGIQLWRAATSAEELLRKADTAGGRRMFWSAYAVTALNPKSIVFFVAFVPQSCLSSSSWKPPSWSSPRPTWRSGQSWPARCGHASAVPRPCAWSTASAAAS
jgi:threonine/homoserine/homoserine lactone efflux protein